MKKPSFRFKTFFHCLLTILLLLSASQGYGSELTHEATSCSFAKSLFEVKTGYFSFSNSLMRKIYNKGGLDIQLCASHPLWNLTNRWTLNAYGAVEYFERSGESLNEHQKTSLWSVPINIGLKPVYEIDAHSQYYFTVGPRYFHIHQYNDSPYVCKTKSRNGLGFFTNMGLHYSRCNRFVVDIFAEYSYAKIHFPSRDACIYTKSTQVGGLTLGLGLGYKF